MVLLPFMSSFLPFLEIGFGICFLPIFGNLSQLKFLNEDYKEWQCNDICWFFQQPLLGMLKDLMDICMFSLLMYSLACSSSTLQVYSWQWKILKMQSHLLVYVHVAKHVISHPHLENHLSAVVCHIYTTLCFLWKTSLQIRSPHIPLAAANRIPACVLCFRVCNLYYILENYIWHI